MKVLAAAAFFVALFAAPGAAFALDCDNAQTQTEINDCAGQMYEAADADLNDTYKQVMDHLGDNEKAKDLLKTAQQAWIKFRDAECTFRSSDSEGGTIHATILAGCLTDMTEERTADLAENLDCEEGDLSCVRGQ